MKKIPEIVAPGGGHTKAIVAGKYGADAIYLGVPFTSLRMRQNKIKTFDELKGTISQLHDIGKKAYLTMNIFPKNIDIKIFEKVVEQISDMGADAIIFSDPGTFNIIRKYLPKIPLHLSTQTSTLNYESVKFWYDLGVKRVVLARELHIDEIAEIKKAVPDMELEIFVHGAMCMSYSGRCLLGEYFSGRDGNKGECSHVCRYKYKVFLQEEKRQGKLYQVEQDNEGSYILSSRDLCTIERLSEIIPYVDGLKIEGRSKGEFYVGACVKAYKHVRDSIINKTKIDEKIKDLVYQIPHRYYWDGFLFNKIGDYPETETMTLDTAGPIMSKEYYGLILPESITKDGKTYFKFISKQNIKLGDKLQFLGPDNIGETQVVGLLDSNKNSLDHINCNMENIYISLKGDFSGREVLYK